jgi:hypothetical protein
MDLCYVHSHLPQPRNHATTPPRRHAPMRASGDARVAERARAGLDATATAHARRARGRGARSSASLVATIGARGGAPWTHAARRRAMPAGRPGLPDPTRFHFTY